MQKYRLRSALIASKPSTFTSSPPPTTYATRFCIESRTSDDIELLIWQEVRASGPGLGSLATKGPDVEDAAMRSFLLLQFLEQPESTMLQTLCGVIWKAGQLPTPGKFTCSFFSKQSGNGNEVEPFVLYGTGNELKVLLLVLAGLEGEEIPGGKKALTTWIPAKERIQLRRRKEGGYALRIAIGESEETEEIKLQTRQVRALIDCLDAYCEFDTSFGLREPQLEVPPATLLERIVSTLSF